MYICNGVTDDCYHLGIDRDETCIYAMEHSAHEAGCYELHSCAEEGVCNILNKMVGCVWHVVNDNGQKTDHGENPQRELEEKLAYSEEKFTMAERGMQSMSAVVANVWKLAQKMDEEAAAAIESGNAQIELNVAADRIRDAITFSDSEKVSLTFHNLKSQS